MNHCDCSTILIAHQYHPHESLLNSQTLKPWWLTINHEPFFNHYDFAITMDKSSTSILIVRTSVCFFNQPSSTIINIINIIKHHQPNFPGFSHVFFPFSSRPQPWRLWTRGVPGSARTSPGSAQRPGRRAAADPGLGKLGRCFMVDFAMDFTIGKWENHRKTIWKWWFHGKTIGEP